MGIKSSFVSHNRSTLFGMAAGASPQQAEMAFTATSIMMNMRDTLNQMDMSANTSNTSRASLAS